MGAVLNADVAIVGGGLAGLALAVALRDAPLSLALIEGRTPVFTDALDARIYAISPANARFLAEIGVWERLDPQRRLAVAAMEIHGDQGGRLDFSAYASGVSELAWIIESSAMQRELWRRAQAQENLKMLCPARPANLSRSDESWRIALADGTTVTAALVVAADGADSWTRAQAGIDVKFSPYRQQGVVANFAAQHPHRQIACQWFRDDGVLAWLPLPDNRVSMVWSTPDAHAQELLALAPSALAERVAAAGGHRLGVLETVTPAAGFPLRLMRAPHFAQAGLALIGDAAHTIHPLSGHGINLGFQDALVLAGLLRNRPNHVDCGDPALLRRYERARKEEVLALQATTDGLHRLFSPSARPLTGIRNLGLNLTNSLPVVKDLLVRYALAS